MQAHVCLPVRGAPGECYYNTLLRCDFFNVECGIARFLCAMRVFEVRASFSSPRLPLCQISFLSRPPTREKSRTRSLNHSPSLFDAPGKRSDCASELELASVELKHVF